MTKNAKNAFFQFCDPQPSHELFVKDLRKTLIPIFQHKNKLETLKNKVGTKPKNKE